MRAIEDLRDFHKGKEIWILGSGASLCDYPLDFFDGKISITLNWTIVPFPRSTYWHGFHEPEREYLRDEHPEFLPKSIILYPFPGPFHHGRITDPKEFFGKLFPQPIFMRFLDTRPHATKADFEGIAKHIAEKTIPQGYRASGTITHTAIQAAAIMGAKRITLVGCEGRGPHAQCHGLKERYPRMDGPGVPLTENGVRWQVEALAKYGIEVIRYYNEDCIFGKKGYNEIPWKEIKIGEEIPATGGSSDGGAPKVKKKVEMRTIEDLRDVHKGEDVWILGGGESLCDFPEDFFDDKISIALSWAIVGFPRCTYWHGHHERNRIYLRDEHPEFLKKCIICNPFPGPFILPGRLDPEKFFGELVSLPIFLHFWDTRPFPGKVAYVEVMKHIMEKTVPRGYRASGNITHTAIQAAAIMGVKRIILAGVDSRGPHAKCYGMEDWWIDREKKPKVAPMTENCIRWQAEILAGYGIEVIRYFNNDGPFYKKGYKKIPWKEVRTSEEIYGTDIDSGDGAGHGLDSPSGD